LGWKNVPGFGQKNPTVGWKAEVQGVDELQQRILKFSKVLQVTVPARLEPVGAQMENIARGLVPVDTGYLQSTIYHALKEMGIELGATADYAEYVEFGTSRSRAQPYIRPAFDACRELIRGAVLQAALEALTQTKPEPQEEGAKKGAPAEGGGGAPGPAPGPAPAPAAG
jgi:HK97 gp10 family phage protein